MSAGSGASNLGYGNIVPLSNVNGNYVNITNSNNPANFTSNVIPGPPGLAGAKNNVDAAAGIIPGICLFKGGSKILKRKIKNITKKYKMRHSKRRISSIKRKLHKKYGTRKHKTRRMKRGGLGPMIVRTMYKKYKNRKSQKGGMANYPAGYSQYQNNQPITPTYQVAGVNLPSSELGLANPPPIKVLANCTNCVDNYDHYTGKGFPSRGH
jgi:hypothetical protein